ncbi:hypothetical protein [Spirosoma sordidisoli]|uniref:Uncharacterized protein n=1 Tax=Spirosoma sordidisoli TaxID=2502893 RepID=A0A4Q2USQ2_9BACT|nr:hypothetical protein [Spirosoma sordidisoli]RYC70760.1 hypothetical protein EQG79_00985 [Spirosoma sordidisoli]
MIFTTLAWFFFRIAAVLAIVAAYFVLFDNAVHEQADAILIAGSFCLVTSQVLLLINSWQERRQKGLKTINPNVMSEPAGWQNRWVSYPKPPPLHSEQISSKSRLTPELRFFIAITGIVASFVALKTGFISDLTFYIVCFLALLLQQLLKPKYVANLYSKGGVVPSVSDELAAENQKLTERISVLESTIESRNSTIQTQRDSIDTLHQLQSAHNEQLNRKDELFNQAMAIDKTNRQTIDKYRELTDESLRHIQTQSAMIVDLRAQLEQYQARSGS